MDDLQNLWGPLQSSMDILNGGSATLVTPVKHKQHEQQLEIQHKHQTETHEPQQQQEEQQHRLMSQNLEQQHQQRQQQQQPLPPQQQHYNIMAQHQVQQHQQKQQHKQQPQRQEQQQHKLTSQHLKQQQQQQQPQQQQQQQQQHDTMTQQLEQQHQQQQQPQQQQQRQQQHDTMSQQLEQQQQQKQQQQWQQQKQQQQQQRQLMSGASSDDICSHQPFVQWGMSQRLTRETMHMLVKQGFHSQESLRLLTPEVMPRVGNLPLEQELRLKQVIQTSEKREKVNDLTLDELLGAHTEPIMDTNTDTQTGYSTAKVKGEGAAALNIVDFIPGVNSETGIGVDGLSSVNPHQWSAANARIMYELMTQQKWSAEKLADYMAYIVKIAELAICYDWQSVLAYDYQYRQLQATLKFPWASDTPHLHQTVLKEQKVMGSNKFLQRKTKFTRPADPCTGKEICIKFNTGECSFGGKCRYIHSCSKCFSANHNLKNHPKN